MGYNTALTIKNKHLPAIARDTDFGARISDLVLTANTLTYVRVKAGLPPTAASLSDVMQRRAMPVHDYDMQASSPRHSSLDSISVIRKGEMHVFEAGCATAVSCTALATALQEHGYTSTFKSAGLTWKALAYTTGAESAWSHDWSEDAFEGGTTTFCVLNDALDEIARDKSLGLSLAQQVRQWWTIEKHIFDMPTQHGIQGLRNEGAIGAGNHGNPISITGITPIDRTDIVVTGANYGRVLRPYASLIDMAVGSQQEIIKRKRIILDHLNGLARARTILLDAGFHVRDPGMARSKAPTGHMRPFWLKDFITATDDPVPEIEDSLQP